MPRIYRPQTDFERLEALEAAKVKADVTAPADLAFSADTLTRLNTFLPSFRTEMQQVGSALSAQNAATVIANAAKANTKMFISHFFQVFNLGIQRGVYTADQRAHFNLDVNSADVPRLLTEQEIATWGQRIITGDAGRVTAGGAPMSNPTAAQVAAAHTTYINAQGDQSTKKDAYDHEQEDVEALRVDADDLIADIWDEVEFTFRKETAGSKRRKAREYGVRYKPNPGEAPGPEDYSIQGTVTDATTGNPLTDVAVLLAGTDVIELTDAQGKYLIPVQPAGTYSLTFYKNAYVLNEVRDVAVSPAAIVTVNAALQAGAETGIVKGRVLQGGSPQPATVSVDGYPISTITDANGYYTLDNAPTGNQSIRAVLNSNPGSPQTFTINVLANDTVVQDFNF